MIAFTAMDGRTIYATAELARDAAAAAAKVATRAELEVQSTGVCFAIRVRQGAYSGWIFDGEFLRE